MIDMTVASIRSYDESVVWLGRDGEVIGVAGAGLAAAASSSGLRLSRSPNAARIAMVAACSQRQFDDLAQTARLTSTFAFLSRLLQADFSDGRDLHTHEDTIAALLAAWIARRTVVQLAVAFAGTSVPWAHLPRPHGRPAPQH
jgi:crotonobetainyl-CoA:carnitine CoA-transferase CaiB-like acyl-CoA transferase